MGAVLGLIQAMQHLDNVTKVGRGIAVVLVLLSWRAVLRRRSQSASA
jgi:hypothetical protein